MVVSGDDRDSLTEVLEQIEQTSGKGKVKWMKVRGQPRLAYIKGVLSTPAFKNTLHFSLYRGTQSYMALTVLSTANALISVAPGIVTLRRRQRRAPGTFP